MAFPPDCLHLPFSKAPNQVVEKAIYKLVKTEQGRVARNTRLLSHKCIGIKDGSLCSSSLNFYSCRQKHFPMEKSPNIRNTWKVILLWWNKPIWPFKVLYQVQLVGNLDCGCLSLLPILVSTGNFLSLEYFCFLKGQTENNKTGEPPLCTRNNLDVEGQILPCENKRCCAQTSQIKIYALCRSNWVKENWNTEVKSRLAWKFAHITLCLYTELSA